MTEKNAFKLNKFEDIEYYTVPSFEITNLTNHLFTSRDVNLGFNTINSKEDVIDDFKKICKILDTKIEDSVLSNQVHKTSIRKVTGLDKGKGLVYKRDYEEVDGLVTDIKGITLFTFYADCVPLFFLDKKKSVVAVAHAGWKGTVGKIAKNMIDLMVSDYSSNPKDILVAIGPSIGNCCFEVNKDVYDKFNDAFVNIEEIAKSLQADKWSIDLKKANKIILKESNIPSENITVTDMCTNCKSDIFFSYRKEDGKTGRMSAAIMLK